MKTIAVIGSTGSVGKISLKVLKKYPKHFKIEYLFANKNHKLLNEQNKKFKPNYIDLNCKKFRKKIIVQKKILTIDKFLNRKKKLDFIISAISGFAGLDINFKLLKICKNLLIANKESIICGGAIFLEHAKKNKCNILPIDSEHYCINFFLKNFIHKNNIHNFYLTASGGPFLKKKPNNNISIKKVLNHPNWKMGKKNSVNSANLTNKIMELFEAHILFNISVDKLKIKIENNSKIHSIISLKNGLDFFISHKTDMCIPIENSLNFNNFKFLSNNNLSYLKHINFSITNPIPKTFPIIRTGFKVLKIGPRAMIIFVVLNDRLVEMFLNKKTQFNDITDKLINIFDKYEIVKYSKKGIRNLHDIYETINFAKKIIL